MKNFDLAIIGTGSGNALPPEFDDLEIALIEEGRFGGTCLNVGCIPTKMFVYPADVIANAKDAARLGVSLSYEGIDLPALQDRTFTRRIDVIADDGERFRREDCPNITVYDSHARFVAPKTIEVGGERITADQIIIAAGSRPAIPDLVAESGVRYHTNDTIMRIDKAPERLLILGSGYIACEFAHVFSSFGSEVSIIGRSDVLIKHQDADIARRFTRTVREHWDVRLGQPVTAIESEGDLVTITFADGTSVTGDMLLVATGRVPNGDRMNLAAAGIQVHDDGRIKVDEHGRTSAQHVWALGDVSSPYQLKHVANHEAKVVFHNVLNHNSLRSFRHDAVPAAIFTHPQVATVGLTEQQALDRGYEIAVNVQDFGGTAYGWALEDNIGICKIIADKKTGLILGAHILGHEAAMLIQGLIQAMALGTTAREMAEGQLWIHPALNEVVENCLLGLEL